jgi:hypothetical protein
LKSCTICDAYLKNGEGFICPKCRRGPLCRNHRLPGNKVCTSCVFDVKAEEVGALRAQEQGIKGFLRLTQFVFLLSVIFFVVMKMRLSEIEEFMEHAWITDYVVYIMGGVGVVGYVLFYTILYGQRKRINQLESEINKLKFRRLAK